MIAANIKALRKALRLSQAEFGRGLGVSRDVINNLECGRVTPKEVFLSHLCLIYGVNPAWLTGGEGEMFHKLPQADRELAEAMEIFGALSPRLKTYALDQLKGLLQIQDAKAEEPR